MYQHHRPKTLFVSFLQALRAARSNEQNESDADEAESQAVCEDMERVELANSPDCDEGECDESLHGDCEMAPAESEDDGGSSDKEPLPPPPALDLKEFSD